MAMTFTFATFAVVLLIDIAFFGLIIYLIVLLIKALRKYLRSAPVRKEKAETAKTLGEALRQEPCPVQDDPGVRSGIPGRQPPGGVQVGVRRLRPQHVQSAGAGQALWRLRGRPAAERTSIGRITKDQHPSADAGLLLYFTFNRFTNASSGVT